MTVDAYTTCSIVKVTVLLIVTSVFVSLFWITLFSTGHEPRQLGAYDQPEVQIKPLPRGSGEIKLTDKPLPTRHVFVPVQLAHKPCASIHMEVEANQTVPTWAEVESHVTGLDIGGHYVPKDCKPRQKAIIIIPYRDREKHLKLFLRHMHPFLQTQGIEYTIFVIELEKDVIFKKGLLMNAGFIESSRGIADNQCIIFHDVDMLPLNTKLMYKCKTGAMEHLSTYVKQYNFKLPYRSYIGGVVSFRKSDFELVNGFSNLYWGWGGEDDDMSKRLSKKRIRITRPFGKRLHYESWSHTREKEFVNRRDLVKKAVERMYEDGINSAEDMYTVLKIEQRYLYTWVLVSANQTDGSYKDFQPVHGSYNPEKNLIKEQIPDE